MKILTFCARYFIFLGITAFFALPPIFVHKNDLQVLDFTFFNYNQALISPFFILVYFLYKKFFFEKHELQEKKNSIQILGYGTLCFGLLITVNAFYQLISNFLTSYSLQTVTHPKNFLQWIFSILNFILASFNEEFLYRFFIPEFLQNEINIFAKNKKTNFILSILKEIPSLILFSFAHFYLGFLSVLNAFTAHFVLRFCYKKTGKIWISAFIHFLHNLIVFILIIKLQ